MLRCVIGLTFLGVVLCQVIPENPCPNIFQYRQQGGIYYGEIVIPFDGSKDLNLAVNISMVGLYQNMKLKLELLTPSAEILSAPVLKYRLNFPLRNIIPKITQIVFNERIYCYGPAEPISTSGVTNLWANIIYRINQYTYNTLTGFQEPEDSTNNLNNYNEQNNQNAFQNNYNEAQNNQNAFQNNGPPPIPTSTIAPGFSREDSCGVSNDIQTLVVKGEKTIENEFPWLVAMFHRRGVSYQFQCTSNLITDRYIVTAAHCVWFYKAPLIDKEDILLVLGRSDLSHWASTGAIIRTALEVIPHPNYKQGSGHCDVAVIKMNEEVIFKPIIKPICLWDEDTNLKRITGSQGMVAGWGKTEENRKVVAIPRKVAMPVVSQETCLRSHTDFKNLTSDMTFCAGSKDGSGPCSGDSGAGFMVKKRGRWFLRGLVSTAIKNEDFSCNLNEYIVFSDIAKLRDWIRSTVMQ